MIMMMMMRSSLLLCALALPWTAHAGIQAADMTLTPTGGEIHYTHGYIRGPPGYIDLNKVVFSAVSESYNTVLNDDAVIDDDVYEPNQDDNPTRDDTVDGVNDDGGEPPRRLADEGTGDVPADDTVTFVDVAIFRAPDECHGQTSGCDWSKVGIGAKSKDGGTIFCCTNAAIQLGLCQQYGRLIINGEKFQGNHRFLPVPPDGPMEKNLRYGKIDIDKSGWYMVAMANCNEQGREISVSGSMVFKSKHGYLPGELFGFMFFYAALTVAYFMLFLWFGICMHMNEDSRIPIEKWILLTISLGLLETLFEAGDYFVWNEDGQQQFAITFIGIITGILKQGIARCLLVMVSLGWGIVRDSLGSSMRTIIVLAIIYVGALITRDMFYLFLVNDFDVLSDNATEEIVDVGVVLTFIAFIIDVIYILWILDAMNNTMEYLENMNQSRKLMRYLRLRTIFLFSILFAVLVTVFTMVNNFNPDPIVEEQDYWIVAATGDLNFLYVLAAVAILWRPNPNAKEYAYVMELPALEGDNELELTGVVPSAMDDDDDEDDYETPTGFRKNGFHDDDSDHDDRFQIDDGIKA